MRIRHKSKRFFLTVSILILVTIIGIVRLYNPLAYANLISNPSFESGTSGWILELRGSGAGNVSTTTNAPAVGAASAVVNITAATGTVNDVELATYGLSMTSGQTYTVSYWAKAASNRTMVLYVQNENRPDTVYMEKTATLTTSWQQFTYTFTAPATVSSVLVGLEFGASTGTVSIDDVQYYQGTAPAQSDSNFIQNSTCDTDASSWNHWQSTVTRVASPTHSGTGSCFIQHVTGAEYSIDDMGEATVQGPQQGQTYTASAWVRSDTAIGKPVSVVMRVWSGGSHTSYESTPVALDSSWQQAKVTVTVNVSGSTGIDYYILQGNATSGNSFYADDMQLHLGTSVPTIAPTPTGSAPTFFRAINFNGPDLVVDGLTYQAEADTDAIVSGASRFQNQSVTLNPGTNTTKAQMIRSSIWKGGNPQLTVAVPVPNASYNVFVYTWEDIDSATYSLAFEGATVVTNAVSGSAGTWKKLGPYAVTVADGAITLTQTGGDFNLSGIEIHGVNGGTSPNSVITYRDSSDATNGAGETTLTLSKPASTFANDVMIAHVSAEGAAGTTITPPAGWSFVRRNNTPTSLASVIYYKVARAGEPVNYTWTLSPSAGAAGGIAAYYNVDVASPIGNHSGQDNNGVPDMIAPSITATTGEHLLFISGVGSTNGTITPPSGMTARWTSSGGQHLSYMADSVVSASGATGDQTGQFSRSNVSNISHLLALRPNLSGGGPSGNILDGDVANLNYFTSNFNPWVQSVCGDIRIDNGINIPLPANQSAIITNAACSNPGVAYSGDSSYSFGLGQSSTTNHVVGGLSYPEVYEPPQKSGIFSSYANVTQKVAANNITVTNLPCTLNNCTLPNNLASGTYLASGDVTLNTYTYPNNRDYVFLVNGNLTINGNLQIGNGSTVIYVVSGDLIVPPTIGELPASLVTNVEGIFSTDRSFVLESTGTCATERRLNIAGSLIINAARSGGSLRNERDLCGENLTSPTLQVTQRLDYILNVPEFLRYQHIISNEVAP